MMADQDSKGEPRIDWDSRDDIPVLTDIVDPAEADDNEPRLPDPAPAEPDPTTETNPEDAHEQFVETEPTTGPEPSIRPEPLPDPEPVIKPEPSVEPETDRDSSEPAIRFHDEFGVDEAEAAGISGWAESAATDDPSSDMAQLDQLYAHLTEELNQAATRIAADAVSGLEAEIASRVFERLRAQAGEIVGVALSDFARDEARRDRTTQSKSQDKPDG